MVTEKGLGQCMANTSIAQNHAARDRSGRCLSDFERFNSEGDSWIPNSELLKISQNKFKTQEVVKYS